MRVNTTLVENLARDMQAEGTMTTMVHLLIVICVSALALVIGLGLGFFVVEPIFAAPATSFAEAIFAPVSNVIMGCDYDDQDWRDICLWQNALLNTLVESIPAGLVVLPGLALAVLAWKLCRRLYI